MSNMATKAYAAKSSVTRALKQQNIDPAKVVINQDGSGQWYAYWKQEEKKEGSKKPRNGNCARVWELADQMKGARRKDVIAACVEAGVPLGTSKTQYQQWYASQK